MLVCLDCGQIFSEPKHYTETHGLEREPFESWFGCPECGGAYVETYECDECGHWITGDYIKLVSDERICEDCYTTYELGEED